MEENNNYKLISALCYFSIFFAGFILPIAVYFIVDNREVKDHAKRALLSHLIPLITIPIIIMFSIMAETVGGFGIFIIFGFVLAFLITIVVTVWNVVKGIQVLKTY
jgi:glycopeptide antibiotics resistance protein